MSEAERLRGKADQLDADAAEWMGQAKAARVEAARLRARADRLEEPEKAIRVRRTTLTRARGDGLLAAAGVAVEGMDSPFTAADLGAELGVDDPRAMRLLLAIAELGKVVRLDGGGWIINDPVLRDVRDLITGAGEFSIGDVMGAVDHPELDVADALTELRDRGVIEGLGGGLYRYVEVEGSSPAREDRRPPENDPPARTESRATGAPVRVVNHGQRGAAMSGGGRSKLKQRDQNRERMEERREAKAREREAARADSRRQIKVRR